MTTNKTNLSVFADECRERKKRNVRTIVNSKGIGPELTDEIKELEEKISELKKQRKLDKISEKKFSGLCNLRMSPEIHKNLVYRAINQKISLNKLICIILGRSKEEHHDS